MDPQTVTPDVAPLPLTRKVLIVAGATVGLILAGGFAFLQTRNADETVESDASES